MVSYFVTLCRTKWVSGRRGVEVYIFGRMHI